MLSAIIKKYGIYIVGVAILAVTTGFSIVKTSSIDKEIYDAKRKVTEVEAQLKTANAIIEKMHEEHDAALQVANTALKERMDAYETAKERICEAEKKIGKNSNFCDQFVPDDFIMLWKKQDADRIQKHPIPAAK